MLEEGIGPDVALQSGSRIKDSLVRVGSMLEGTKFDYEIVVVDDGSTDGTAEEASKVLDGHVKISWYQPNRGKGYALKYGFQRLREMRSSSWTSTPRSLRPTSTATCRRKSKLMTGVKVPDTQGGFKACRRHTSEKILPLPLAENYAFN